MCRATMRTGAVQARETGTRTRTYVLYTYNMKLSKVVIIIVSIYLFSLFPSQSFSLSLPSIHGILCPSCPAGHLREGLRRCCFLFVSSAAKKSSSDDTPFLFLLFSHRFSPFVRSSLLINNTHIVFIVFATSDYE